MGGRSGRSRTSSNNGRWAVTAPVLNAATCTLDSVSVVGDPPVPSSFSLRWAAIDKVCHVTLFLSISDPRVSLSSEGKSLIPPSDLARGMDDDRYADHSYASEAVRWTVKGPGSYVASGRVEAAYWRSKAATCRIAMPDDSLFCGIHVALNGYSLRDVVANLEVVSLKDLTGLDDLPEVSHLPVVPPELRK